MYTGNFMETLTPTCSLSDLHNAPSRHRSLATPSSPMKRPSIWFSSRPRWTTRLLWTPSLRSVMDKFHVTQSFANKRRSINRWSVIEYWLLGDDVDLGRLAYAVWARDDLYPALMSHNYGHQVHRTWVGTHRQGIPTSLEIYLPGEVGAIDDGNSDDNNEDEDGSGKREESREGFSLMKTTRTKNTFLPRVIKSGNFHCGVKCD